MGHCHWGNPNLYLDQPITKEWWRPCFIPHCQPPLRSCLTVRPLRTEACPADQSQSTCLLAHIKAGQTSATHCFCLARPASGMSLHTKPGGLISIWRCHLSRSNRNLYTARHWLIGSDIIFQLRQGLVRLFPYRGNSPSPKGGNSTDFDVLLEKKSSDYKESKICTSCSYHKFCVVHKQIWCCWKYPALGKRKLPLQ